MAQTRSAQTARLTIQNIGGIDQTTAELPPGVTVLTGENATNRTSFLTALSTVMGTREGTLRTGAESGYVELQLGETEIRRSLRRVDGTTQYSGDGWCTDPDETEVFELFGSLLESNPARRAIREERTDDLRDLMMQPVDTEAIEEEIRQIKQRRSELEDELARVEAAQEEVIKVNEELQQTESTLQDKQSEFEEVQAQIDELDAQLESEKERRSELDRKKDQRASLRSQLGDKQQEKDAAAETLEQKRAEKRRLEEELAEIDDIQTEELSAIESRIAEIERELDQLEVTRNELSSLLTATRNRLEDDTYRSEFSEDDGMAGDPTSELVESDEEVTCWTCGSTVQRSDIQAMVDEIEGRVHERTEEMDTLREEKAELEEEKAAIQDKQERKESLEQQIKAVSNDIGRYERRVSGYEDKIADLEAQIEALDEEIRELRSDTAPEDELEELSNRAGALGSEVSRLETKRNNLEEKKQDLEETIAKRGDLESAHEELTGELEELRGKIDQLEQDLVSEFNDRMEDVLGLLEYENVGRIWIEKKTESSDGRRSGDDRSRFELHVVRETEQGGVEGRLSTLSESEREVTGVVFALAGYLVHEVHEVAPFMLLDSIEAVDAARIKDLIEYLEDVADYLVVALLPEDADPLPETYHRITDI